MLCVTNERDCHSWHASINLAFLELIYIIGRISTKKSIKVKFFPIKRIKREFKYSIAYKAFSATSRFLIDVFSVCLHYPVDYDIVL